MHIIRYIQCTVIVISQNLFIMELPVNGNTERFTRNNADKPFYFKFSR